MKKTLCLLIACIFAMMTACSKNQSEQTTAPTEELTSTAETQSLPKITQTYKNIWYRENNCDDIIGPDIPQGEYIFKTYSSESVGKYEIYNYDADNESKGSLVKKGEFSVFQKITLERGQILVCNNMQIYWATDIANKKHTDGSYLNGIYKVGTDMPAGTYVITCDSDKSVNDTDFAVMKDLSNTPESIIQREKVMSPITVELKEGQYVFMVSVSAKPEK